MFAYFYFGSLATADTTVLWGGLVAVVIAGAVATISSVLLDKFKPVAE